MKFIKSALIATAFIISMFGLSAFSNAADNLVSNPSLEVESGSVPLDWLKGGYGTNTPIYSYPVEGENGGKAASVELTSRSSGDAKWYFKDVTVTGSEKYLFEASYKSTVVTDVTIQYQKSGSTTYYYYWLGSPTIASNWNKFSKEFTAPDGATNLTVFMSLAKIGKLTVDSVSLTKVTGTSPQPYPNPVPPTSESQGMVSFDFDDGWTSTYQNAIPILNNAGIKSTQYIITNTIDKDPQYMNKVQITTIYNQGHEIQSHTVSHAHLTKINATRLKNELVNSKNALKNLGFGTVDAVAYPYGEFNNKVITAAKNAGYLYARAVETGYNDRNVGRYKLRTQNIINTTTFDEVKGYVDNAVRNNKWLILVFHEMKDNGDTYSSKPSELQKIVDYVKSINVKVVTVSQGVKEIYGI